MAGEFKVKDEVYVISLKRVGTVVGKSQGKYRVSVGPAEMLCSASDLKARESLDKNLQKDLARFAKPKVRNKTPMDKPLRVDLHGMRVEEAMRVVEKSLDRAIIEEFSSMEVVHGIGTGAIRAALHRYLKELSVVSHFRLDDQNAGVTWVYF